MPVPFETPILAGLISISATHTPTTSTPEVNPDFSQNDGYSISILLAMFALVLATTLTLVVLLSCLAWDKISTNYHNRRARQEWEEAYNMDYANREIEAVRRHGFPTIEVPPRGLEVHNAPRRNKKDVDLEKGEGSLQMNDYNSNNDGLVDSKKEGLGGKRRGSTSSDELSLHELSPRPMTDMNGFYGNAEWNQY